MRPSELLQQLKDDTKLAQALLALMEKEFELLNLHTFSDQLQEILEQKRPLIQQLSQHSAARNEFLTQRGVAPTRAGLERLLRGRPERVGILSATDTLGDALSCCHQANERNGKLINLNQSNVRHMLDVLRGTSGTPSVYNSNGATEYSGRQRSLSQA